MTPEEVQQAVGKPTKKTSRLDAGGREDIWEFIRYERVPQESVGRDTNGNLVSSITYIKVPAGTPGSFFANSLVTRLNKSEGSLEKGAQAKIVPAPFSVTY